MTPSDNYVTWRGLQCVPKDLECIVRDFLCKYSCNTNSTNTVDVQFINATRTLIVTVNGVSDSIVIPDIVTTLVNNNNGTATYTNEIGIPITFPIGGVTAIDNGDGTYTLTLADGTTVTILDTSVSTMVDNGNGTFTYTDELGTVTTFSAGVPEIITTLTNTILGHKIGQYNNEAGVSVDINETVTQLTGGNTSPVTKIISNYANELGTLYGIEESVTSLQTPTLLGNILTIPYLNESGVVQNVTVNLAPLTSPGLTPVTDEFDSLISGNSVTLTNPPNLTRHIQVFRNGIRRNSTEYNLSGVNLTFTIPFGTSSGASGGEQVLIDYYI
jgi:hypothetical protein